MMGNNDNVNVTGSKHDYRMSTMPKPKVNMKTWVQGRHLFLAWIIRRHITTTYTITAFRNRKYDSCGTETLCFSFVQLCSLLLQNMLTSCEQNFFITTKFTERNFKICLRSPSKIWEYNVKRNTHNAETNILKAKPSGWKRVLAITNAPTKGFTVYPSASTIHNKHVRICIWRMLLGNPRILNQQRQRKSFGQFKGEKSQSVHSVRFLREREPVTSLYTQKVLTHLS